MSASSLRPFGLDAADASSEERTYGRALTGSEQSRLDWAMHSEPLAPFSPARHKALDEPQDERGRFPDYLQEADREPEYG